MARLGAGVARFGYDRAAQAIGIVHFGIGAFHRAHQAWYTDLAMETGDRDWAICGVSLRSADVAAQLNPQDGLYTLTTRSQAEANSRIIGAVREVLVAATSADLIAARIAAPSCHIVSFTVTEKGYARGGDGALDFAAAERSFYPILTEGLRQRCKAGLPGLTLLSCDNLADNGAELQRLMGAWLAAHAPDLAEWFAAHCTCPATMIDRIVPATTDADRAALEQQIGMRDEGAVFAERFSQWVIEDRFAGPRPAWEGGGAQLVADVAPYEMAKLRMLNGAHSALAYLGLERGFRYVHEAIADPDLRSITERLMREEAAPSVAAAPGQDLSAYADQLLTRFSDPALNHRLVQIAMDGSQKIPQRWLATLASRQPGECPAIMTALGAWLRHLRNGAEVNDPLADTLGRILRESDPQVAVEAVFGTNGVIKSAWICETGMLAKQLI